MCEPEISKKIIDKVPVIEIELSYKNLARNGQKSKSEITSYINRPLVTPPNQHVLTQNSWNFPNFFYKANYQVDIQFNRVAAADALEQAKVLADSGKLSESRNLLTNALNKITSSISGNNPFCVG